MRGAILCREFHEDKAVERFRDAAWDGSAVGSLGRLGKL